MKCPYCGETEYIIKSGKRRLVTSKEGNQVYRCKTCKKRFTPDSEPEEKEKYTYKEDGKYIHVVCDTRRLETVQDVIDAYDIDMDVWKVDIFEVKSQEAWRKDRKVEWEVENGTVNKGSVNDSGKILIVPLTHIKVRFARKTIDDIGRQDLIRFLETYEFKPSAKPINKNLYSANGMCLEICLADLHIGRMTFENEKYTSREKVEIVIKDVIRKVGKNKLAKIILAPIGDITDADNTKGTTTQGTQQVLNMTPYSMISEAADIMILAIEELRKLAPVDYKFIPGNHDETLSFAVAKIVEAWFRNDPDVVIDVGESAYKWDVFGINLIAWTHGDVSKNQMFDWLPVRARKEWGGTKYAEIHSGHINPQVTIEKAGQVVRFLPTMADESLWEERRGYGGPVRATISFLWDKEYGLQAQWFSNVV